MRIYCPVWFHCTLGASGLSQEDLREYGPDVNSLALAIARLRKTKASAVHYKISAIMFHSGVKHDDLICLGVCMSPDATVYIYMFWHSATSLWLVADFASVASYTTSLFGNIEPSRPRFCNDTTKSDHNTGNSVPYSFRTVRGFFYVPQDLWTMKNCETGPTVLSSLSEKTRKSNHVQM